MTRRRVLFIGGSFIAAGLATGVMGKVPAPVARWSGQALGAHATVELVGLDGDEARPIFRAVEAELERLEGIFSLYRPQSALAELNRRGQLDTPPSELLEVLSLAHAAHHQTSGLFDPTVQPLFELFASYYGGGGRGRPAQRVIEAALTRVGMAHVSFDSDRIEFAQPGMALTLNGIAQGYITDKVADLLRDRGFGNLLLNLGEIRAIGSGTAGEGWRIGIPTAAGETNLHRVTLSDGAVATSMMLGTTLDGGAAVGHILHPQLGLAETFNPMVTVIAPTAARADALSTAATLMQPAQLQALRNSGAEVYL